MHSPTLMWDKRCHHSNNNNIPWLQGCMHSTYINTDITDTLVGLQTHIIDLLVEWNITGEQEEEV